MRSVVWIGIVCGGLIGLGPFASAQDRFPYPFNSRITAEMDRRVQLALQEAHQLLEEQQFVPAIARLQSILDHPEDYFLEKTFQPREQSGVRAEALRALADLPAEGRAAYELQVGNEARTLLKEAIETSDEARLSKVASVYQMTAAGFEALQILAATALDNNRLIEAGLICDAMLEHPSSRGTLRVPVLLQSALAWHLADQPERSMRVLQLLNELKGSGPWEIGGRRIQPFADLNEAPAWLRTHFGPAVPLPTSIVNDWELPRGGLTGNESAMASCPVGGGAWRISARQYLRFQTDDVANQERIRGFDQLITQVEQMLRENNRLTQPSAIPLVVGDVVVYRTVNDVTAVSLKSGRMLWRSAKTDGMLAWLFQSPQAASDAVPSSSVLTFRGYLRFKMFRDQLMGSLSSDGTNVYAIEESESQFSSLLPRSRLPFGAQMVMSPVNKLVAYDLAGGRLKWEVGGQNGTPPAELAGLFFVGPPLPWNGRLYCLAESKNELRLISLIPESNTVRLEWSQALVATERSLFGAAFRFAGLVPATAEGLMICPSANGSVVAYDVVLRQLRWGYSYETKSNRNPQGAGDPMGEDEESRWLDSRPVITRGRVLITPRDSNEIHCIDLIDGTLIWKRLQQQGLYIACVNDGQVIVVGRNQISAYSLVDGSDVWTQPTEIPEPSGRGVQAGQQYLLPLSTGDIATVELSTGRILGRSKLPEESLPGNLAVGDGALVSCGTHDVIGFRPLNEVEQQVADQLTRNPDDAAALALRGELRLHRGQELEAIDDLRKSLQQRPEPDVKRVLAETMLNRLRKDPGLMLETSSELESLTDDPRQRVEFLRLYANSLNQSGDRIGAISQLFRLALTTAIPEVMVPAGPGHFISQEQSVRAQLFAIYEAASPANKAEIDRVFSREFDATLSSPRRIDLLPRFVKLTVGHPAADPLLLRFADSPDGLAAGISKEALLERLTRSDTRTIAAAATASLAAYYLNGNVPREARPWLADLAGRFADDVCRNGKTGRQLNAEWSSRSDVQKVAERNFDWPAGRIEVVRTEQTISQPTFPVEVVTHVGNFFEGWSFETDAIVSTLTARDSNLKVVWKIPLINSSDDSRTHPCQLHIRGRRLALASGMWLGVLDASSTQAAPELIFEQSLRPGSFVALRSSITPVQRRLLPTGRMIQFISDGRGFLIGLSDEAVVYQLDNRIYAADPETGRILWSRVGPSFARVDGTVDRSLILSTSDNGAILVRLLDGAIEQQHKGNPNETTLWYRGTRRLSQRILAPDQQRIFEMHDFDGDRVVWQSQHPVGSKASVIAGDELAILEQNGKLTILKLSTGEKQLDVELPLNKPLRGMLVVSAQPAKDHYIVVAGISTHKADFRRIEPFNLGIQREFGSVRDIGATSSSAFAFEGMVLSIDRQRGAINWSVPVTDAAYDTTQPANLPVLVLAAWHIDLDPKTGFPRDVKLSTRVIDKRTGAIAYESLEIAAPVSWGIQYLPSPDARKVVIDLYVFQLELGFVESK